MIERLSTKYFVIPILIIFLVSFALYHSSLNYYFFQDDFFEINISKAQSFIEYLNFYKFRDDNIAYRPVSLQNYFFLSSKIFGFDPGGFRVITFTLFFSSALLLIAFVKKITGNIWIGFLTTFFWLTSSIHFMAITWIAAAYNITGTFFWFLTSLLFLKFLNEKKIIYYVLSLIAFLITIGSFEFSVTWPVIFGFYYFFVLKNSLLKSAKVFSPFIFSTIIYLLLRMLLIKIPAIQEYNLAFNLDSAKALFWYVLWSFNIPEEFKKQVIENLIIFNQVFLRDYWTLVVKSFMGLFTIVILGILYPIYRIYKIKQSINHRLIFFGILWFCVTIFPVLLLPNHNFIMYLTLPSIGLYFFISYLILQSQEAILPFLIFFIWFFLSFTTINFYKVNFFFNEAQRFSRDFSLGVKKQFPRLPKNSIILYQLDDPRYRQALFGNNAVRALYDDSSLLIYYNKEDLLSSLRSLSLDQLGAVGLKENLSDDKINNKPVFIYIPE